MKIRLNKIALENYRCFPRKVIGFFQKTEIFGRNKQGKSTVMNAYMEVITGKESNGSMPDGVRPHNENGDDIPKVDVIRELDLEIEGKPTTIRKITKQKYDKRDIFKGNETAYEIDDFSYRQKEFAEFMEKIAKPDILLMCSNANPFLSIIQKSTAEARKILEKLAGFDLDKFIRDMGTDYAEIAEICKGHSIEDASKKLRKQLTDQKKKIEAQNTKISYERSRVADTTQIEVADLKLVKGEWKEKIASLDAQEKSLDEAVKSYDDLAAEILELKEQVSDFKQRANESLINQRVELRAKISESETKKRILESDLRNANYELEQSKSDISAHSEAIEQARKDYAECLNREFDESKLHEIEAEQFNEDQTCPTCKRKLPPENIEKLRKLFEESREKRIKNEKALKMSFDEETEKMFDRISESGNKASERLKAAQAKKTETEKKIAEIQQEIQTVSAEIERMNAEFTKLPQEVDLSGNEEYQSLLKRIEDKEVRLSYLKNGSDQRTALRQQRNKYLAEISNTDSQIQKKIADAEEKERRIATLETELRSMSQIAADIEKQIDLVTNFSIQKNAVLAEKINPYFHHFQFEFLEFTQDGAPIETCKLMCGGTSYFGGLNGGDKKLCEVDLCRGLQEMNNLILPIWVDESNTIDPWRIPQDLEQQIILIQRTDGELAVKEI